MREQGRRRASILASFFLLFFFCSVVQGGIYNLPTVPTREQCLYFADDNGVAEVLKFNSTEGPTILANGTEVDPLGVNQTSPDRGILLATLPDVGYLATGVATHNNLFYVASFRFIAVYNITNDLERLPNFIDFSFLPYSCIAQGLVIFNEVMYVSCYIGTFPMLKFSVAADTYGDFLAGTTEYHANYGHAFRNVWIASGEFVMFDDYTFTAVTVNGTFAFVQDWLASTPPNPDRNIIWALKLDDDTPNAWITTYYVWVVFGNGNYGIPTPLISNIKSGTEYWWGSTFGTDGNLYTIRRYITNLSIYRQADVLIWDGTYGYYIGTQIPTTTEMYNGADIVLGPAGDFFISTTNFFKPSYIYMYDRDTGLNIGDFFVSTVQNDIVPKSMIFTDCPSKPLPADDSSTDDTLPIVLGTVLPILGAAVCCFLLLILALIIYLIVARINDKRRRTYTVGDEDMEMGRKGKTHFTYREIDPDELEVGPLLGEGAYGKVYKGTYRGAPVAIKTFDQIKLDEADEMTLAEIREEAEMMERLGNHPNVISFVGAITKSSNIGHELYFSLVTEYCPNGSLFDFLIKKKTKIPLITLIKMARDIAAGILHLHKEKVIHRDIATRNILVGANHAVYLSDFGMARIKEKDVNTTVANVGPVKWMAPECMTARQYSEASDAFAYGVTLWEMITRKIPWKGMDPVQVIVAVSQKNTRLEVPAETDPVLKKIIKSVWRADPSKRMTMKEIVSKLDSYLKTLEEVYEEMSSDGEDGTSKTDREYFSDNSTRGGSSRPLVKNNNNSKQQQEYAGGDTSDSATDFSSDTYAFYGNMSTPSSGKGGKGKDKVEVEDDSNSESEEDYGVMPDEGGGKKGGGGHYGMLPEGF